MRNLSFSALAPTAMAVIAACILATGGALLFSSATHAQDGANAPRPALTVQTAPPQRTAMTQRLAANGNIAAWQEASIGAESNGLRLTDVRVNVGDVVIARTFLQHDMDASPIFPRWQLPGYGCSTLACDEAATDRLVQAADSALRSGIVASYASARVHEGLIASGDQFVSSRQASAQLRADLEAAGHAVLAVEMEGAAVAQTCLDYGTPFTAMRSA